MSSRTASIHEVLAMGPIVFSDEDMSVLITVNGSYFNWWIEEATGEYQNTDCRPTDSPNGLEGMTVSQAMDRATAWFEDTMSDNNS